MDVEFFYGNESNAAKDGVCQQLWSTCPNGDTAALTGNAVEPLAQR